MSQLTDYAMEQGQIFDDAIRLTTDMYVLLQLFTNCWGIDIAEDFHGLSHVYHSVHTHPHKLPKTSWSATRVMKAIEACEADGLIEYGQHHDGHKWTVTKKGKAARAQAYLNSRQSRVARKAESSARVAS